MLQTSKVRFLLRSVDAGWSRQLSWDDPESERAPSEAEGSDPDEKFHCTLPLSDDDDMPWPEVPALIRLASLPLYRHLCHTNPSRKSHLLFFG